jgi:hypothetical protein
MTQSINVLGYTGNNSLVNNTPVNLSLFKEFSTVN